MDLTISQRGPEGMRYLSWTLSFESFTISSGGSERSEMGSDSYSTLLLEVTEESRVEHEYVSIETEWLNEFESLMNWPEANLRMEGTFSDFIADYWTEPPDPE